MISSSTGHDWRLYSFDFFRDNAPYKIIFKKKKKVKNKKMYGRRICVGEKRDQRQVRKWKKKNGLFIVFEAIFFLIASAMLMSQV